MPVSQSGFLNRSKLTISYSRILISQDHNEIYVTIAEYERAYLKYLCNKVPFEQAGYLTMHRFGPFMTQVKSNMEKLGGFLKVLLPYAEAFKAPTPSPSPSPPRPPIDDGRGARGNSPSSASLLPGMRGLSMGEDRSSSESRASSGSPTPAPRSRSNQRPPGTGQPASIPAVGGPAGGLPAMQGSQHGTQSGGPPVPQQGNVGARGGLQSSQTIAQPGGPGGGRGNPAVQRGRGTRGRGRGGLGRG